MPENPSNWNFVQRTIHKGMLENNIFELLRKRKLLKEHVTEIDVQEAVTVATRQFALDAISITKESLIYYQLRDRKLLTENSN